MSKENSWFTLFKQGFCMHAQWAHRDEMVQLEAASVLGGNLREIRNLQRGESNNVCEGPLS